MSSIPNTIDSYNVAIGDICVVGSLQGKIVTHALGTCVAVTLFDPDLRIGGMLHFMLPFPVEAEKASVQPWCYGSLGVPALFKTAYALGAEKRRLIVCAAGAAELSDASGNLQIGYRNRTILRKLLWKNDVALAAEDVGGGMARSMELDLASGAVTVRIQGSRKQIWPVSNARSA
jgi:chemotaxis protein CheD